MACAVTKSGRLVGSEVTVDGVALWRFLGIPFAQSTAGDRRFAAPMPLAEPADRCGLQEFLEPRPPCAQWVDGSVVGSEDCLRVNVWTSAVTMEDKAHGGGRALVVAVSGRWFETGSNDDPDWPKLAAKGHVVVVAPNHRQGVLGFLHLSSVVGVEDDVAVDDVVSAVQWALDHAEGFGADPKQLVLVGHGSGGYLLSAAARKLRRDAARRAFYQGIVFGSLLPFDSAKPYLHLASALNCSGVDKSAWVSCFRAAPVDVLLQAAQATSHRPLHFAPGFNLSSLQAPPADTPHTVIAGADAADDKALFRERILPLAQRDGNASTTEALVDYMFNVFNVPEFAKFVIKSRFSVHSVDEIAEGFSTWVSTCATLKVAKAVAEGYHYRLESAVASGLLRPPLGIGQVAQFAAHGTVPPLADKSPWLPLGKMAATRVVGEDGHENLTNYDRQCTV
ncbi:carboxylesterase 4A-like [Dermacentor andersoni]|uniref:carboxylesterase 4A-like n=1 Tax=Dermacentor andersoni TaxID=34620 RepID=UPI003B3AA3B6